MRIKCNGCKGTIIARKPKMEAVLVVHNDTCPGKPACQHERRGSRRERQEAA
jgi:hypothetical protein